MCQSCLKKTTKKGVQGTLSNRINKAFIMTWLRQIRTGDQRVLAQSNLHQHANFRGICKSSDSDFMCFPTTFQLFCNARCGTKFTSICLLTLDLPVNDYKYLSSSFTVTVCFVCIYNSNPHVCFHSIDCLPLPFQFDFVNIQTLILYF